MKTMRFIGCMIVVSTAFAMIIGCSTKEAIVSKQDYATELSDEELYKLLNQGESADLRVVEALRQALADDGGTTLDPSHKSYPRLDMHLHLYMSTAQARTLASELRKGESKEPFYLTADYKGVAFAAAFSLVLIGDEKSARRIVELGFESVVGSYKRAYFFKLAHDLGFSAVAVELARIYVQNKDISGFSKEFKKGCLERRWALDCLSVMDDLEMLIPSLKGDDKNVLKAATEELKKPGM